MQKLVDTYYTAYTYYMICPDLLLISLKILYFARENLVGIYQWPCDYTIYGNKQMVYYLIWYNRRVIVRQLFVSEVELLMNYLTDYHFQFYFQLEINFLFYHSTV